MPLNQSNSNLGNPHFSYGYGYPPYPPMEEEEIDLKEIFSTLKRNIWWIVAVTLLTIGGAGAYLYFTSPVYQTSATLEVTSNTKSPLSGANDLLSQGMGLLTIPTDIGTEMAIIQSRSMIERALKLVDFTHRYYQISHFQKREILPYQSPIEVVIEEGQKLLFTIEPLNKREFILEVEGNDPETGEKWEIRRKEKFGDEIVEKGKFKLVILRTGEIPPDTKYQFQWLPVVDTALALQKNLSVTQPSKGANIIEVSFQDTIPQRGAQFVNTLVQVYLKERIKQKTQQADQTLQFIDSQLKEVSKKLAESETALENYKKNNKVVDLSFKAQETLKKLNDVETQYNQLILQEELLNMIIKKLHSPHSITSISTDVIQDPLLGNMIGELQKLLLKKEQLLMEYTPQHPAVIQIEKQIKMLQSMIANRLRTIKKILESKKASLKKLIDQYTALLKNLPKNERRLVDLKRNYMINEKIYSYLLEKRAATAIARSSIISDNRIIDTALVPQTPVKPKKRLILAVAGITGVILGIFLVFLKEFLNTKITSLEEVERLSPIPIVGSIPVIKGLSKKGVSTLLSPNSPFMEAFRVIRANIQFLSPKKRVITVTSTIEGEGKSTISSHLALVYALANKKCVVVNLDMRKPTLHKIFNIPNDYGISDVLANNEGNLERIIHKTQFPNLFVVPSGTIPPNPGELLESPHMEKVWDYLTSNFEVVIFDTPPVGLVIDALEILAKADINLHVVRLNYSKKEFFKTIGDLKENKGIKGMGLVVNGVKNRQGYKYSYGYYS
ncbi:MAG: hypothetical protein C6I01_00345 [Epsilonproteobacteria bacterium]|nr:hypothetical protein [Campylobacterota bacterium]NPA88956.1 polysaccharide biosynthesis tyrosine autokinase [Campylobacterota bacterium]